MAGTGLGIGVSLASIARLAASTTAIQLGITGTDLITQDGRNLITQDGKNIHTSPIYLVNSSLLATISIALPPNTYDGLTTNGYPIFSAALIA